MHEANETINIDRANVKKAFFGRKVKSKAVINVDLLVLTLLGCRLETQVSR